LIIKPATSRHQASGSKPRRRARERPTTPPARHATPIPSPKPCTSNRSTPAPGPVVTPLSRTGCAGPPASGPRLPCAPSRRAAHPSSTCAPLSRLRPTGELLPEEFVHHLGVGFALGELHDLAHQEPDGLLLPVPDVLDGPRVF